MNWINQKWHRYFIWGAVMIFAVSHSVVSLLNKLGMNYPIEGRNAISFCNLLFVGNLCAGITLFILFRKDWTQVKLSTLKTVDWIGMLILSILSGALAPSLIFLAIESTTVTNVILVGRVEPIFLLILSILFLKDKVDFWTLLGLGVSFLGILVTFFLQHNGHMTISFGKGEVFAVSGAAVLAVSTLISKYFLQRISLGIFTVFRTVLGAFIFFIATVYLYGSSHFTDVLSPFLWQWMLIYGAIIVVGGQLLWLSGIKYAKTSDVSLATSFLPIAGIGFAFLLLSEVPSMPVLIGGSLIIFGILIAQTGQWLIKKHSNQLIENIEMEGHIGFKGL